MTLSTPKSCAAWMDDYTRSNGTRGVTVAERAVIADVMFQARPEPEPEPTHPPYGRPSIDMARQLPAEKAREVYEAIIAERCATVDEMQGVMDRLAECVAEAKCDDVKAECPPAAGAQPFTVEEALDAARNHAQQAARIRSQIREDTEEEIKDKNDYNHRFAEGHERDAATLRAYAEQEGRIADLEQQARETDETLKSAAAVCSKQGNELDVLERRFATVRAEAEMLIGRVDRSTIGDLTIAFAADVRSAAAVILAACEGTGGEGAGSGEGGKASKSAQQQQGCLRSPLDPYFCTVHGVGYLRTTDNACEWWQK